MTRDHQKQIWADEEFKKLLEKLQARAKLNGIKVTIADITKKISKSQKVKEEIEKEIIEGGANEHKLF